MPNAIDIILEKFPTLADALPFWFPREWARQAGAEVTDEQAGDLRALLALIPDEMTATIVAAGDRFISAVIAAGKQFVAEVGPENVVAALEALRSDGAEGEPS